MKFYQNKQSNQSKTYTEYEYASVGEQDNAGFPPGDADGEAHQDIKQVFVSLINCHAKTNIATVDFKWHKVGDCFLEVHAVKPFNKSFGN